MSNYGRIELIIGCMWSGKSTELIRQAKRYSSINKKILIINHESDERYGKNVVSTHDSEQITCISVNSLKHIFDITDYKFIDIILIDEAQFFQDLYNFANKAANEDNKILIISGLDGDFKRNQFGDIIKLIPHAEKVTKLNALCNICNDGSIASFTHRKIKNNNLNLVGGQDEYMPVCRFHYNVLSKLDMNNISDELLYNLQSNAV